MPAPVGNNNSSKGKDWINAVRYALKSFESHDIKRGHALKAIAKRVVADALEGKEAAWREIAERLDGKVAANGTGSGAVKVLILRDNSGIMTANILDGQVVQALPAPEDET